MASEHRKERYKVGDKVVIYKRVWIVEKIYHVDHRYRVRLVDPKPEDMWTELYPDHNEITGIYEDWEARQISIASFLPE